MTNACFLETYTCSVLDFSTTLLINEVALAFLLENDQTKSFEQMGFS